MLIYNTHFTIILTIQHQNMHTKKHAINLIIIRSYVMLHTTDITCLQTKSIWLLNCSNSVVERPFMVWGSSDRSPMVDPLSYFSFQPLLHKWRMHRKIKHFCSFSLIHWWELISDQLRLRWSLNHWATHT